MTFLALEYFLAVAGAGSISSAAEKLMISQQALSEQLRRLESELGVTLINRSRPMSLTSCGEYFADYAARMLQEKKVMERKLAELAGKGREILLSVSAEYCPPYLHSCIAEFEAQHPACTIKLNTRSEHADAQELAQYDIHFSSSPLSSDLENIYVESPNLPADRSDTINSNELSIVVQKDLLSWKWKERFDDQMAQLQNAPSLLLFQNIPFLRMEIQPHATTIDRFFIENGFSPDVVINTASMEMSQDLCRIGAGAMLLPKGAALRDFPELSRDNSLLLIPLKETWPAPATVISYQKGKKLSQEEQAFIAAVLHSLEPGRPL